MSRDAIGYNRHSRIKALLNVADYNDLGCYNLRLLVLKLRRGVGIVVFLRNFCGVFPCLVLCRNVFETLTPLFARAFFVLAETSIKQKCAVAWRLSGKIKISLAPKSALAFVTIRG